MTIAAQVEDLKPLTSLRFFAAVAIVLFHGPLIFQWPWLGYVPTTAYHGVSFFFTLSGFILAHVYSNRPTSYGAFLRNRVARLWPTHLAAFAFAALLLPPDWLGYRDPGPFDLAHTAAPTLLLLQSLSPHLAYVYAWNAPAWSISTEMFFYLAFPALLAGLARTWPWKLLLVIALGLSMVALTAALGLQPSNSLTELRLGSFLEFNPLARLVEFFCGMLAYLAWRRWALPFRASVTLWSLIEVAAIVWCLIWLAWAPAVRTALTPDVAALHVWLVSADTPLGFAPLIVAMASGRGLIGKLLATRPLAYLGLISFAVYMFHMPVMKLFQIHATGLNDATAAAMYFACVLLIAAASYELIEKPARNWLTRPRRLFAPRDREFSGPRTRIGSA